MTITFNELDGFAASLRMDEKDAGTIEKYVADAEKFVTWLNGRELTKEEALCWKEHLFRSGIAPSSVNGKLSALNALLRYLGEDCHVKYLKLQRKTFCDPRREMTLEGFKRLLAAARKNGDVRMFMLMETITATGIRVSELQYITVEAVQTGQANINLKGKVRQILIPAKLAKKLLKYAGERKITAGAIFVTRNGTPMNRKHIWSKMKALCEAAGVDSAKVFPHNLRHLCAWTHYERYHDIAALADVMGHSSIETTRIYLITTGLEFARQMDDLQLVS